MAGNGDERMTSEEERFSAVEWVYRTNQWGRSVVIYHVGVNMVSREGTLQGREERSV